MGTAETGRRGGGRKVAVGRRLLQGCGEVSLYKPSFAALSRKESEMWILFFGELF